MVPAKFLGTPRVVAVAITHQQVRGAETVTGHQCLVPHPSASSMHFDAVTIAH